MILSLSIALQPSEPRNLTVNSIVFDFERVEFYLNISWKGPDFPEGKIKQYFLVINSESAIAIIDEKIEVAVSIGGDQSVQ